MAFGVLACLLIAWLPMHVATAAGTDTSPECPDLRNSSSGSEVLNRLVAPCRYDQWARPGNKSIPIQVGVRLHVYFLGAIEAQSLQFTAHILLRLRWLDSRLEYENIAPQLPLVVREGSPKDSLWTPHVYLVNEQESVVMGADKKDILLTVEPDGTVVLSARMKVTLFCLMNLQKFPFDQQECPLVLESWTHNTSELSLFWESESPVTVNKDLHLTEYRLVNIRQNFSVANDSLTSDITTFGLNSRFYGKFGGNYSALTVRFDLAREVGHYIMDYFMPSILLVVVSWVSFWLDPNAVPGRTTLGTSTMLTFITLTRNTGSSLPKVSYIKATEIWFIVCTAFIFGSLVEFAFVNTIWRRKRNVELKKVNSKYILRSTLTPQMNRKQLHGSNSSSIDRCQSWPTGMQTDSSTDLKFYMGPNDSNTLTVNSIESVRSDSREGHDYTDVVIPVPTPGSINNTQNNTGFTTMTPQQIAQWIDRRSRVFFPASFILFNVLYWGFVWI